MALTDQGPGRQNVLSCVWQLCRVKNRPTHDGRVPGEKQRETAARGVCPRHCLCGRHTFAADGEGQSAPQGFNGTLAESAHLDRD